VLQKKTVKIAQPTADPARRNVAMRSVPIMKTVKTVLLTVERVPPLMVASLPTAPAVEAVIVSNVSANRMPFAATPNGMESA
jgi:hypothetical protein